MVSRPHLCRLCGALLLFVLIACGPSRFLSRSPEPTEVGTVVVTPSPHATATPLPDPTPTPEPTPVVVSTSINLAAAANGGRVVWATDEYEEFPASNLINGRKLDFDEWWSLAPLQLPQVIVFSLADEGEYVIDSVVLNPFTTEWRYAWPENFEIYVSTDSTDLKDMGWVGSFTLEHLGIDQVFYFDPVRARYVALVITSQYGGTVGVTLNEFEVYAALPDTQPVEPVHLTQMGNLVAAGNGGRIVDYSSQDGTGNYPVESLNDGVNDSGTGWSSDEDMGSLQYVVFSFPGDRPYLVGRVVLNPYSDEYLEDWTQDFEVWGSDVSPDPADMWQLGTFWLDQTGEDQSFSFDPVLLRYIAFVPLSNYGGTEFALNEFEVYQPGDWSSLSPEREPATASVPEEAQGSGEEYEQGPLQEPEVTFVPGALEKRPVVEGDSALDNIAFRHPGVGFDAVHLPPVRNILRQSDTDHLDQQQPGTGEGVGGVISD